MSGSIFDVLLDSDKNLAELGYQIEKDFFESPSSAVMHGRQFAEKLLAKVCEIEGQVYLITLNQYERMKILYKDGILDYQIYSDFNNIRIIGNKAIHDGTHNDVEYAAKVHKKIYKIIKWYIECYGDANIEIPLYIAPSINAKSDSISMVDVNNLVEEKLSELLNKNIHINNVENLMNNYEVERNDEDIKEVIEQTETENKLKINYNYSKLKGSYLLHEISKLSSKSKEGVESYKGLNPFKKYIHVKRSIQEELVEMIEEAQQSKGSQLILLCGSVGDGKSHLLSYLNEEYKGLLQEFYIHNDATESHDPKLTAIETLQKVLSGFSDENIDTSNKKLILAINLGVLNNFLEEDFAKVEYTKFKEFIDNSNIFNQEGISNSHGSEHFKLVSFGDYNIYELTENGAESFYIEELLNKIVKKSEDNPFYQSYLKDKKEGIINPFIINYEILSKPGVTKKITDLLVTSLVKHKKILGTRELLNFIYEILIPPIVEEDNTNIISILQEINNLLPNLIFNSNKRGELLKITSKEDPIKIRHRNLDQLLIQLNIATDIRPMLKQYFDEEMYFMIEEILGDTVNLNDLSPNEKEEVIEVIIRLLRLCGKEDILYIFEDSSYKSFMKYLYYYNKGEVSGYKSIFDEVRKAIYNWNGSPKNKYIYLNKNLSNFKVAEEVEFKPNKLGSCLKDDKIKLERFKRSLTLGFEATFTKEVSTLELDYQLYNKIVEINEGYCTSKNDKEEAIIFVEFIDKLLSNGNMEEELLVEDKRDNRQFILRYEDNFGDEEFVFERLAE